MSRASSDAPGPVPLRGRRLWLAIVVLLVVAVVTIMAGRWQLSRAQEKAALGEAMARAAARPMLALTPEAGAGEFVAWRPAVAQGAWQPGYTVLLDNRNHEGAPGRWLASPLCLAQSPDAPEAGEGEAIDCDRAVLVLRGWQARERPGEPRAQPQPPTPGVPVEGRLIERIPRLFELSALAGDEATPGLSWDAGVPVVQNLALDEYAAATGLPLLPMVLEQRNETGDGLVRDWPALAADTGKHTGYALQWFAFAAIALIALGVIVVKSLRTTRR